ncbi:MULTISPECIES: STAS domain-containing protein [Actinomadura]|uniref:Anti-sigma factor antagonist n=1 Tax=Actinomadura yumaensis TaxID=111807 RepID=A0ABW2CIB2_9ACTN|nr:STAS domain-containing protein [Actinomadura sp. J1-007]MWK34912.1 anti-sigma factor antagonist [Actinomadura sp. J1-007]
MLREASRSPSVRAGSEGPEPWTILRPRGELDCARADELRAAIGAALAGGGRPRIALDLGDVAFCDSYGLSVLVFGAKKVGDRGGVLLLSNVTRQVRSLIKRCGLEQLLTVAP